jgi:hypothetical protein
MLLMLVAELHGHHIPETANSEDYLTSTVFGHLRYLPPKIFWDELFRQALAMPGARSSTLAGHLQQLGIGIRNFETLEVRFWSRHPECGCPDLILVFSGAAEPLIILIEAKLWAEKSGTGEFDQIARYLRLLDKPETVIPRLPKTTRSVLIYLTEHDSLAELEESINIYGNPDEASQRVFRLQWQDIVVAAQRIMRVVMGVDKLILGDVAAFLSQRNLEYFSGFRRLNLPLMSIRSLDMFSESLFTEIALPSGFEPRKLDLTLSHSFFVHLPFSERFMIERGPWL